MLVAGVGKLLFEMSLFAFLPFFPPFEKENFKLRVAEFLKVLPSFRYVSSLFH